MANDDEKQLDQLDHELKQFLDWQKSQAMNGYTIANLMAQQNQFQVELRAEMRQRLQSQDIKIAGQDNKISNVNGRLAAVETDNDNIHRTLDLHGTALIAVKRRVRSGPEDTEMDTGVHQLALIQHRLAQQEEARKNSERVKADDVVWWKRSIIMWVVGAFAFVATTAVTILVTLAIIGKAR